jgi:deoxyribonuclease V
VSKNVQITPLHDWNLSPAAAIALQNELRGRAVFDRPLDVANVQTVAGVDVSVRDARDGGKAQADTPHTLSHAAVVVLRVSDMQVIEAVTATLPTPFPYVPGLLSFREGPVLVEAFRQLQTVPDALIFDGMGRAHPRQMGIAVHMGLWLGLPTVGCGKTHFIGDYADPAPEQGSYTPLSYQGEVVGAVLRTRSQTRPVYISAGHEIDLASSIALVLHCTSRYRLPDPIRAAHLHAGKVGQE